MRSIRQAGHRFSTRTVVIGAAAMVAVPLAAAAADASTPNSGTINGCSLKTTGSLRVIHPGLSGTRGHCTAGETPVSWNQVGPQGPRGPQGATGLQGLQGDKGDQGVQGLAGVSGYEFVQGSATSIAAGSFGVANATCPAGKVPVGGGYSATDALNILFDAPIYSAGWSVQATNGHATSVSVTVFVLCVNAS